MWRWDYTRISWRAQNPQLFDLVVVDAVWLGVQAGGVDAVVKLYAGKTHTQPMIEDPMSGGCDVLTDEILSLVRVPCLTVP